MENHQPLSVIDPADEHDNDGPQTLWQTLAEVSGDPRYRWRIAAAVTVAAVLAGLALWATVATSTALLDWVQHGPISHSINDPVKAWLDTHTRAGLPATSHDLWIAWLATLTVLWLLATTGSRYARVGWLLLGLATGYAAHQGAPLGAGPAAAATTFLAWVLLSVPVYRHLPTTDKSDPDDDQRAGPATPGRR